MIAPKSDQKNADDFLTGPQTFTITAEIEYDDEQQPAGLVLDGDTKRPYKPGKSMGRVRKYASESSALVFSTCPSIRTTRSSSIQWNCSAAFGLPARSRPLRLS